MTLSSAAQTSRSRSEENQPSSINASGKDSVTAYLASITNPTTRHLHDDSVVSFKANQEDVERDYSSFCAGLLSGAQLMTAKLFMPESPEEAVRRVWQQYKNLQQEITERGNATAIRRTA